MASIHAGNHRAIPYPNRNALVHFKQLENAEKKGKKMSAPCRLGTHSSTSQHWMEEGEKANILHLRAGY